MAIQAPAKYETVIGLEVHVQLKTDSKLFDASPNAFGDQPNINIDTPCLGLPGALPVLNERAVEYAIKLGLALDCTIAKVTKFDRKQYFYPDLPKGYQISQYDFPICEHGTITLSNGRKVRVLRAHLEEDAGKLVHAGAMGLANSDYSLVDLNRAGCPLVEVVSEPDIRSAEEAREYMQQIRNIVRYLDVCDGNLEEGSMRCDANVSIRPYGATEYGTKTEIKNMNSFRSVQRAIESEVARQTEIIESGGRITQESRLWDEATQSTKTMRSKEEAHDYRYFPDPDLRPLAIADEYVEHLRQTLPELPHQRYARMISGFGLSDYDAGVMVEFKEMGDFFELAAEHTDNYKAISNWIQGDITAYLKNNKVSIFETKLSPKALADLVHFVDKSVISSAMAKKLMPELLELGGEPEALIQQKGLAQISDEGALRGLIQKVIDGNPANVEAYRAGKDKLFGFFVGQVMKESKGSANPELVNQLLKEMLG
ncbi:Asp-tRNA(Asn)/Glu-tRNA(Gln) amidotransferase subunit GatB [Vampirovibrio sp.]|uniref:Asp-tRNA(Asn)/Glu-tRNA(Gln) amidotransferase subunit GatB n=1 Tax=Vampirovibrio sp. TaxID=2717857 RepID=UPI0035947BD0